MRGARRAIPVLYPASMRLVDANQQAHLRLEATLFRLLDTSTRGDMSSARTALATLRAQITAHVAVEDAHTLPALEALGLGKLGRIVDGDHRVLHRSMDAVEALLAPLPDGEDGRAAVLRSIETLSKLKTVLEHHGVREQEDVYPRLDAEGPADWAPDLIPAE